MFRSSFAVLLCLLGAANAHFRLLSPEPRGQFVADIENQFCGGYPEVTTNRTTFPLEDGSFTLRTNHAGFTVGVLISTVDNPNNFDNFSSNGEPQLVRQYATEPGAGTFCIPLDIAAANIPGVGEGSNVTIQIVFDGGDGLLYQCADLTLSSSAPSLLGSSCTNATTSDDHGHTDDTDNHNHGDDDHDHDHDHNTGFSIKHETSVYLAGFATVAGLFVALM